jgi:Fe-S cluster biogenesis protein NfuA
MKMIEENIEKIKEVIEKLRCHLQKDGGDMEFVRLEENTNVLEIRFLGNCKGCPLSIMTLRAGIERVILKELPFIIRVEEVK